jgi:opacity protein-like surface antigen
MKKVLLAGLALAMVIGSAGFGLAGGPVSDSDSCCGDVQTQIDNIKSAYAKYDENTKAELAVLNDKVDTQGDPDDFYISGDVGINFASGTDVEDIDFDDGWQGSIAIGNRVQEHIRLEAEYQYLDTDNTVKVNSLMGNLYYDFGAWSGFAPYATMGFGIGWFDYTNNNVSIYDDSMVWKIGAGVDYNVTDKWSVGVRYTYFDAVDNIDFDTNQVGAVVTMRF